MLEKSAKTTSIVAPNGTVITIPYYEIGNFFKNIIDKFICENQKNQELFEAFQKDYHYFSPYLDFALIYLNYKIQNPFIFRDSILYAVGENLLEEIKGLNNKLYLRATDNNYNIKKISVDNITTSLISPLGIQISVNRDVNINHMELTEIYLLETMISNKELYEDYTRCMLNPDLQYAYPNIERYFRGRLGFLQASLYDDGSGFIIYNKSLESEFTISLLNGIKYFYPDIIIENHENLEMYFQGNEIEKAKEIERNIGEKYESRRI